MTYSEQIDIFKQWLTKHRCGLIFLVHGILAAFAYTGAFLLRFDGWIVPEFQDFWLQTLPLIVLIKLLSIRYFRLYTGLWRYAGLNDLVRLFKAVFSASVASIVLVLLIYGHGFPRSVFVIDFLLTLVFFGGLRFLNRFHREFIKSAFTQHDNEHRVLILGAGDTGDMAIRTLKKDFGHDYQVVGFLDDDPAKHKLRIHDVPVLGTLKDARKLIEEYSITDLIFAIADPPKSVLRNIVNDCASENIAFHIMPTFHDVVSGRLVRQGIRNIQVEDLLGRDPIHLDHEAVEESMQGQNVLITGGGGSIGSELARQVAACNPAKLVLLDVSENALYEIDQELKRDYGELNRVPLIADIKHRDVVKNVLQEHKPDIVYHAAAFKHVPLMEQHPDEAVLNNIFGTLYLAEAATEAGVDKFIMISTDKAVRPSSIMGATKRCAELIMSAFNSELTKCISVRFGNVLGSNGSVVPLFRNQIAQGGPVTVTDPEMTRYFITIPEAVELVLQAGNIGQGGEVFVLDMGDPIKIVDLARNMIELSGLEVNTDIAIEYIGLRPGEKLHEELVACDEEVVNTSVPKIMAHRTNGKNKSDIDKLYQELQELKHAVYNRQIAETKRLIWQCVKQHDNELNSGNQNNSTSP